MRLAICLAAMIVAGPATAQNPAPRAWDGIRDELYGGRPILGAGDAIVLDAPYRTDNDIRTVIGADLSAPTGTGIVRVTLVLDNNPMPVSAVIDLATPQQSFAFDATMRINGPTPLRVVAEMADGRLLTAEAFVKTSGLGACAAPPGTDPELALATLGRMQLELDAAAPSLAQTLASAGLPAADARLSVEISHPSHSGMQMDQISLLYIPMRYLQTVEVDLDGSPFASITGSISLSENPALTMTVPATTQLANVRILDTDGTAAEAQVDRTGF